MTEFLDRNPQQPLQPQPSSEGLIPETMLSPEVVNAAASIVGAGSLALERTVNADVEPRPGFMQRRWDALKSEFDPRNTPAGKAVVEAGQTFSKWDLARSVAGRFAESGKVVASIFANVPIMGLAANTSPDRNGRVRPTQAAMKATKRLENRVDSFASGTNNTVLRRKMAAALLENNSYSNPVQEHLSKHNRAATDKIRQEKSREQWRRDNPQKVNAAHMLGGSALGAAATVAPSVAHVVQRIF
ncbi:hypothetical protein H7Y63_01260 [Polaromonas sp.]|nr:hypothetical protein [Candidatus Saccharibacteria bacterium]